MMHDAFRTPRSKPFIAELHDIGKLVDVSALKRSGLDKVKGHTYHKFDLSQLGIEAPASPSWLGQWHDEFKSLEKKSGLPANIDDKGRACLLLTVISDRLASTISRTRVAGEEKPGFDRILEGVNLLWRPNYYKEEQMKGNHWAAFRTPNELKEMFNFIDDCESPEDFFTKYKISLSLTPEDKSVPRNIIPLRTHLDLTGKIFRVLLYWTQINNENGMLKLKYDNQEITSFPQAAGGRINENNKGKWIFRLIKCYVRFPQSIARLQDLNVLELRGEMIRKIVDDQKLNGDPECQPYAVLFNTDDFLCLILPRENILDIADIVNPLLQKGFWIEYEELEAELNLITSNGAKAREQLIAINNGDRSAARKKRYLELRRGYLWPNISEIIEPPLCDLCQQRRGERYIKDQITEWLCPICYGIRKMGEPAKIISEWEDAEKQVLWLKVSLDQEQLARYLQLLFDKYIDNGPGMAEVPLEAREEFKKNFRPLAAQMEFIDQYRTFLKEFRDILCKENEHFSQMTIDIQTDAITYPIKNYNELTVIRLDKNEILGQILDAFYSLLQRWFPECLEDCPIRLAASLGNIKYPYQEHWRFFEKPQLSGSVFRLQQPGTHIVELKSSQFLALRNKLRGDKLSHALHQLAVVETDAGDLTAMIQALNQRKRFPEIFELMWQNKLSLRQILDFYSLVGTRSKEMTAHVK
ncbi:MAG: hypothetical protein IPI63_12105 [Methanothrix sp.]|jgi:hypothetical protein|uniref:hypothetical protein n=1 Tax=Methanothrix sp. TaxID=90426 RepID=UPI0025F609D9|nr:hypothetical protein [Methanothrix sp.]MBK7387401.1 hypothetical protein [Methanothrix sp.]